MKEGKEMETLLVCPDFSWGTYAKMRGEFMQLKRTYLGLSKFHIIREGEVFFASCITFYLEIN